MTNPTDKSGTPRTDAAMEHVYRDKFVNTEFARQLETELNHALASLAEARAEVERLRGAVKKYGTHDGSKDYTGTCYCGFEELLESLK
jgi:hypothetical protein